MEDTRALIAALPLKEMDATLLRSAILDAAREADLDIELISRALDIAAYAHRNQTRASRGKMPRVHYIEHPYRVALRVIRYGLRDVTEQELQDGIIAAILHDTVEDCAKELALVLLGIDTPVTEAEARAHLLGFYAREFGTVVSLTVQRLSNPLSSKKLTREESNAEYVDHVLEAIVDALVFIIKFADFADNALSLHHSMAGDGWRMVVRLATKYGALVAPFSARLDDADVLALVGPEGVAAMRKHLGGNRLAEFAAYEGPEQTRTDADTIGSLRKTVKRLKKKATKANARADENDALFAQAVSRLAFLGNNIRPALNWLANAIESPAGVPDAERKTGFHFADVKAELKRVRAAKKEVHDWATRVAD
jgi:hypothetical protein